MQEDAKAAVARSAARYIAALGGDGQAALSTDGVAVRVRDFVDQSMGSEQAKFPGDCRRAPALTASLGWISCEIADCQLIFEKAESL